MSRSIWSTSIRRSTPTDRITCSSKDEGGTDSESQITAFEDTWHWSGAVATYHELIMNAPVHVSKLIEALHETLGD
jgi:hypothetical protein